MLNSIEQQTNIKIFYGEAKITIQIRSSFPNNVFVVHADLSLHNGKSDHNKGTSLAEAINLASSANLNILHIKY